MAEGVKRELEAARKSIASALTKMDAGVKKDVYPDMNTALTQLKTAVKNHESKKKKRKDNLVKLRAIFNGINAAAKGVPFDLKKVLALVKKVEGIATAEVKSEVPS